AYTFLYMSSMCNPIIYAFRSAAFREGYKEILCQQANYVTDEGTLKATERRLPRENHFYCPTLYRLRPEEDMSTKRKMDVADSDKIMT
ncbi:melanopsin isoform X2, partial [Biomphalaria glabrata]